MSSQAEASNERDLHRGPVFDFVLTNPPFNMSGWGNDDLRDGARWPYGVPPEDNANFAWLQHIVGTLSPLGTATVMMPNGAASTQRRSEAEIRRRMIEADLIESIIALPGGLFDTTRIPVMIWVLNRDKAPADTRRGRDRQGETLFMDATSLGVMVSGTRRRLSNEDWTRITDAFWAWRGAPGAGDYRDSPGFCSSVKTSLIAELGYVLTPGRYVRAADSGWPDAKVASVAEDLKAAGWQVSRLADFVTHTEYLRSEKAPERAAKIRELRDEQWLVLPIEPHFDAAYGPVPEAVIPNRCLLASLVPQVNGIFLAAWLNSTDGRRARDAAKPGPSGSPRTVSSADRNRFLNALVVPTPLPNVQTAIADTTVMLNDLRHRAGELAEELWRTPSLTDQIQMSTRCWLDSSMVTDNDP